MWLPNNFCVNTHRFQGNGKQLYSVVEYQKKGVKRAQYILLLPHATHPLVF
jgi:hypothetical protein